MTKYLLTVALLIGMVLSAHAASAETTQSQSAAEYPSCARAVAADGRATPETAALPEWQSIELTNAATGKTFAVGDYGGCAMLVQTMATWCPNCRAQLDEAKAAMDALDPEKVVVIAVSVEPDLPAEALAQYATDNGFAFVFAVAPIEMMKALDDAFGRTVLAPPASPHFTISPEGEVSDLMTGETSSSDLMEILGELSAQIDQ